MGHKLGVAEAHRVGASIGFLEVFPRGVRQERLEHVLLLLRIRTLIEQTEADRKSKGPLEDVVVVARQHSDVDRHMVAFARAVPVRKHGRTHAVAVPTSQERLALQFQRPLVLRFSQALREVGNAPDERAVVDRSHLRQAQRQ